MNAHRLAILVVAGCFLPSVTSAADVETDTVTSSTVMFPATGNLGGDLAKRVAVLKNDIELRQLVEAESQIETIKKTYPNFDSSRLLALIKTLKLQSRQHLDKARLLAQLGKLDEAMKEFQTGAELWPDNPDLQSHADQFFGANDARSVSTPPNGDSSSVRGKVAPPLAANSGAKTEDAIPIKSLIVQAQDRVQLNHEITDLGSPLQEVRNHAAEVIRDNHLYDPTPRESWDKLLESLPLHNGDSQAQVVEQLNKWGIQSFVINMPHNSGIVHYRLDDSWVLVCAYDEPGLLSDFQIVEEPRVVGVTPPSDYTGLWRVYRINGESTGLLYYNKGKCLGTPQDGDRSLWNLPNSLDGSVPSQ